MNQYPLWKYILVFILLISGLIYALPNIYGVYPVVQISADRNGKVDESSQQSALEILKNAEVDVLHSEIKDDQIILRFANAETQLKGQKALKNNMGQHFVVAQNLIPATPLWLQSINAKPMFLGLDLRGGVHFLMEVDMKAALTQKQDSYSSDIRVLLREQKVRQESIVKIPFGLRIHLKSETDKTKILPLLVNQYNDLKVIETKGNLLAIDVVMPEIKRLEIQKQALQQNITTLRNRVNQIGVSEPVIQQQGLNRIIIQLPGLQDPAEAKRIIGATATLEFRMVDQDNDANLAEQKKRAPIGSILDHDREGRPILLKRRVMLTGDYITDASSGLDQRDGRPAVYITLNSKGARKFEKVTAENVGRLMGVVFIEDKFIIKHDKEGNPYEVEKRTREVINTATINERLGKRFQITGLDDTTEARRLALFLRAGALAAPMKIVEERTVGPSLGKDNIDRGFNSVKIGFIMVLILMILRYKQFGFIADVALGVNLVLLIALLSLMQATLTLPGIAGIVLTVGMAVDANVLIFERIREEIANGSSPQASIHSGYEKALSTIADANITTLIAAAVLFSLGSGPVKGFAVTLGLGIMTSMYSSIVVTRAMVNATYGGRQLKALSI